MANNESTDVIREKVDSFEYKPQISSFGHVLKVGDGIFWADGLEGLQLSELVELPGEIYGMALSLAENYNGIALLNGEYEVTEGMEVRGTGHVVQVPVQGLEGRIVDPIGRPLDAQGPIQSLKFRPVEHEAPAIIDRDVVERPLQTGWLAIDAMVPIGKGQRELIIGDRQTGKTALAVDTIINQRGRNVRCFYVAIGQKISTVKNVMEELAHHNALSYTTVVFAGASDPAPMQYIAPYAGCAMAEHVMEEGGDALIVYDDLSKHAVAYRSMSLLLRRPPGREAYPGDVFYLHSRLLERAAQLSAKKGGGSITALPIVETMAGDISAYIPTNVISITDGQIFLRGKPVPFRHSSSFERRAFRISCRRRRTNARRPEICRPAAVGSFPVPGNESFLPVWLRFGRIYQRSAVLWRTLNADFDSGSLYAYLRGRAGRHSVCYDAKGAGLFPRANKMGTRGIDSLYPTVLSTDLDTVGERSYAQ